MAVDGNMSDWTTDAANAIDNAVGIVRERTVEPVQSVVRVVTYGLLAGLILVPAATMSTIAAFRLLVIATGNTAWAAWLILGGIFVLGGWFCWSRRTPRASA
jgi:hypothetical protein